MFFEKNLIKFEIIDIIELHQKNVNTNVAKRNFSALSFRINSKASIKSENNTFSAKSGDICLVTSDVPYTRTADFDNLIAVHFLSPDISEKELSVFSTSSPKVFEKLFSEILKIQYEKQPDYKFRRASIFNQILAECYLQNHTESRHNSKIYASYDYINQNFTNPDITIKEIAEKSFMSEVYFRKLFKSEHGVSPREYIINLRIKNAIRLMEMGYYTLAEVAELSGWNDYRYFTTEFKRKTGASPSKYEL